MDFISNICNPTIIICTINNKNSILKELNKIDKLIPITFLTINELYNSMFFSYDKKCVFEIMNKYNINYEIAVSYLKYLIYLEDKDYHNDKINYLVSLKKYLNDNKLLIYDEYFYNNIKNKDIILYGISTIDKLMYKSINILKKFTNVKIINNKSINYSHNVIEFNHIEDEIEYVVDKICDLIQNGVNINNIKLTNVNDEYIPTLKRMFYLYNIPIILNDSANIFSTIIGKEFIENYESNLDNDINLLKEKYDLTIVNQVINIINDYYFVSDKLLVKDLIINDLKKTKVKSNKLENYIEIIDIDEVKDNQYVFMIGFNQGSVPIIIKDEGYLNNNELKLLDIETTIEKNIINKKDIIEKIKSVKNLIITYKLESYTNNYFPSNLIDDMNLEVINDSINYNHSILANKITLCKFLDKYYKYNIVCNNMYKLLFNYKIPYKKYNNRYNNISFESLNKILENKLYLSYSGMEKYNECAFKFYIGNILKLDVYEDTFSAFIGTLFHYILEIGIKNDINVKDEINKYIEGKELSNKELFYVEKLNKDIEFALNVIKEQLTNTRFSDIKTENKFLVNKEKTLSVTFNGFIDKIMSYSDESYTYVALIDYKTYDMDVKMDLIDYGINIQLPIYIYLVNNAISNVKFAGFYVQRILNNNNKYTQEDVNKIKKDNMKLIGYSNSDTKILELFDPSYRDSNLIKGMKIKNDGEFSSYAKVLSDSDMKNIINKVDYSIDNCIDKITNTNFDINPKKYNDKNIGCNYCKYRDICYMSEKDIEDIIIEGSDIND